MRTATSYAPLTAPRSWPPCVTWPSASSDSSTAPASPSPQPPDPCQDALNEPSDYSPKPPPKPTLPTPCALKGADPRFILCRRIGGVITCAHAMKHYGLPLQSAPTTLHIAVPGNQGHIPDAIGRVVTHRLGDLILPAADAAPVAPVEQALICYLRCADELDALIALDAALRLGLTTRSQLESLLRGPRNHRSRTLVSRSLPDARSLLETIARYELEEAGYRPATAVFVPGVGEVDLVLTAHPHDLIPGLTPDTKALRADSHPALLIETDGYAFHSSHLDWEHDHLRDQAAITASHVPLRALRV